MFACLYVPAGPDDPLRAQRLVDVARTCSPRVSLRAEHIVTLDIDGLTRLFGHHRAVAEQVRRVASENGYPLVHVAVAATQTAAILLASMRPGITVVDDGGEAAALAPLPLRSLEVLTVLDDRAMEHGTWGMDRDKGQGARGKGNGTVTTRTPHAPCSMPHAPSLAPSLSRWGIRTLGQLAELPPVALSERLGQEGVLWQRWARGEDPEPLVPTLDDEVFEDVFEPEWPIEGTDALACVLDRLLEPLCQRLERRDRAAAVLHVQLRLVTRDVHARSLQLPAPMRDPEVLRTLLMLALEAHPAPAAIDVVTVTVDPTPGRVVQESLLTRALPPPEQVSTLMARLGALMGERRCGSPALVDTHRPGMFAMVPFNMGHGTRGMGHGVKLKPEARSQKLAQAPRPTPHAPDPSLAPSAQSLAPGSGFITRSRGRMQPPYAGDETGPNVSLRRFRLPISARVVVEHGRPAVVRTERQNLQGGAVRMSAGPWRTSGEWWKTPATTPSELDKLRGRAGWNRDEWDVALHDGGIYRIFEDRDSGRWFVDGIVD